MVVEIAFLRAKECAVEHLREGLRTARDVIAGASGYRGSTFYQGIEDPRSFILEVQWDSVDAHMVGFREGPLLSEWRSHFYQFLDGSPTVRHFTPIAGP